MKQEEEDSFTGSYSNWKAEFPQGLLTFGNTSEIQFFHNRSYWTLLMELRKHMEWSDINASNWVNAEDR